MKKILAMLLALVLGLLPTAMAEGWVEDAVEAGRCLTTEFSLQGIDALEDYRMVWNTQDIDAPYGEFALLRGGEEILSGFGGKNGDTTYFNMSLFGVMVLAFREGDPAKMLQNIMGILQDNDLITSEDMDMLDESGLGLGLGFGLSLKSIDLEDMDFTPLLMAVMSMEDCLTMTAREEGSQITARITPENAEKLFGALLETLSSNPQLQAAFEKYADRVEQAKAALMSKLAGDLVIDVLLNGAGMPYYASISLKANAWDAVRTFVFEFALNTGEDGVLSAEASGAYSDEGGAAHTLFKSSVTVDNSAMNAALVVGENGVFALNAVIPTPEETDTLYRLNADVDVSGLYDGREFAYHLEMTSEEKNLGVDAARTTVVTIGDAATREEIATAVVDQATGEAIEAAEVNSVVYPAEMTGGELTGLGMNLLFNSMGLLQ